MAIGVESIFSSRQDRFLSSEQEEADRTKLATKASDTERTNTDVKTADPDLQLRVNGNTSYKIDMDINVSADSATPDIWFEFSYPEGTTGTYTYSLDGAAYSANQSIAYGTGRIALSGAAQILRIIAYINVGQKSGIVSFDWAQFDSDSDATEVKQGSNMIITKI